MNIYSFVSKLFGTPRIVITNLTLSEAQIRKLEELLNEDNQYPLENKWILKSHYSDWTSESI